MVYNSKQAHYTTWDKNLQLKRQWKVSSSTKEIMEVSFLSLNLRCNCYYSTATAPSLSLFHRSPSVKLKSTNSLSSSSRITIRRTKEVAATDMRIDFGRYKGKMLGTLPSTYLKWVSSNLRARDFEHWANLADQVLAEPVYRDRIEWEFAQNLLNGDNTNVVSSSLGSGKVSALLAEISERFGWDNDDKLGWSRIDFSLLGTSKGGRIPRTTVRSSVSASPDKAAGNNGVSNNRRSDRRERLRVKRSSGKMENTMMGLGFGVDKDSSSDDHDKHPITTTTSPFPGRESLFLLNKRRSSTTATGRKRGQSPPREMND